MAPRNILAAAALGMLTIAALVIWLLQMQQQAVEPVIINGTAVPPLPAPDRSAIALGEPLYLQYCAACHGADLRGAPDWKIPLEDGSYPAPPHDNSGHTWHHPDDLLMQIVAEGGRSYGGVMPAFSEQLTQVETAAILEYIKSHWNRESRAYQWWITNVYPTPTPGP